MLMARVPREVSGVWAVFCFWIYLLVISTCVHFGKSLTCIFIICIFAYFSTGILYFKKKLPGTTNSREVNLS